MRAESVSVTDHALLRWNERVSISGNSHVSEIEEAVKNSKIIKKSEPIPFVTNRKENTTYAFNGQVLFVLESISIDQYRLITVITDSAQPSEAEETLSPALEEPVFKNYTEEYNWLLLQKKQTETLVSNETKGSLKRKTLVNTLHQIEEKIFKNKIKRDKEIADKYQEYQLNFKKNIEESVPIRDYGKDITLIIEQLRLLNLKVDRLLRENQNISLAGGSQTSDGSALKFELTN